MMLAKNLIVAVRATRAKMSQRLESKSEEDVESESEPMRSIGREELVRTDKCIGILAAVKKGDTDCKATKPKNTKSK